MATADEFPTNPRTKRVILIPRTIDGERHDGCGRRENCSREYKRRTAGLAVGAENRGGPSTAGGAVGARSRDVFALRRRRGGGVWARAGEEQSVKHRKSVDEGGLTVSWPVEEGGLPCGES